MSQDPPYIKQLKKWAQGDAVPAQEPIYVSPSVKRELNPYHPHTEANAEFDVKLALKLSKDDPEDSYAFILAEGRDWNKQTAKIMKGLKLRPVISDDQKLLYLEDSELSASLNNGWRAVNWRTSAVIDSAGEEVFLDEILWVKGMRTQVTTWTWRIYAEPSI